MSLVNMLESLQEMLGTLPPPDGVTTARVCKADFYALKEKYGVDRIERPSVFSLFVVISDAVTPGTAELWGWDGENCCPVYRRSARLE